MTRNYTGILILEEGLLGVDLLRWQRGWRPPHGGVLDAGQQPHGSILGAVCGLLFGLLLPDMAQRAIYSRYVLIYGGMSAFFNMFRFKANSSS